MGKHSRSPQNGEVPQDSPPAVRLRPEEILAKTFSVPFPTEANEGWSPRARRLFLVALAVAGAVLVLSGLLLTGELGSGPGTPQPLGTGPDITAPGGGLLSPLVDQPGAATPPATTPPTVKTVPPVTTPSPQPAARSTATPTSQPVATNSQPETQTGGTQTTTTTLPCNLLGSRALGAQVPPLCR
jgi:hypothetical protein